MKYFLTAVANVKFEYTEGEKDSTAIGCASILHSEGIDESLFVEEDVEKKRMLNKRGSQAMQRIFATAIATNMKYAEQRGFQSVEGRTEFLQNMQNYILSQLAKYDAKKEDIQAITKDGLVNKM